MSDLKTLIAYLNPNKHKSSNKRTGTEEYHFIKIDGDFLGEKQYVESKNITKIIKKTLDDPLSSTFKKIDTSSILYVEINSSDVKYYFQKEIDGKIKYITLEKLLDGESSTNNFTELDDSNFVKIEEQDQLNYHEEQEAIYIRITQLAEINIFSKRALYYNPKELGGLTNGEYVVNFKDAKGYTGGIIEQVLGDLIDETDFSDFDKRLVSIELNPKEGKLYWYPDKVITNSNKITLFYDYHTTENDDFEVDPLKEDFAIKITFKDPEGFLGFMMVTYFLNGVSIFNTSGGNNKYNFSQKYIDIIYVLLNRCKDDTTKALSYLYYLPLDIFQKEIREKNKSTILGTNYLWKIIGVALDGMLTNYGVNSEDIVLKLLQAIKITQNDIEYKDKEKNNEVLKQLLTRKTRLGNNYLLTLYAKLNTSSFVAYNTFIYKLWRKSSFTNPANKVFEKTSPFSKAENSKTTRLLLPYKTNKLAGFYSSNMNLSFTETGNIIVTPDESSIDNVTKAIHPDLGGLIENFIEEDWQAEYHPLQPVYLADPANNNAVSLQRLSPMLLLKVNEDKSFWSNVGTTAEYAVDAITTLSGIGNLAKFRHLARIVKTAKALNKSNKFVRTYSIYKIVKGAAAGVEITSGTVNALLKITGVKDTELGNAISEFLFWLELASLSGEIGAAIGKGLQKSAKTIVDKGSDFNKHLDDLVKKGEIDDLRRKKTISEIENVDKPRAKIEDFFKRFKAKGKPINEIIISDIVKQLKNVTSQSTLVSRGLSKRKIGKKVYDDITFEAYFKHYGGSGYASAFEYKTEMFFRETTPIDKFFNEIVHEGTHALDEANGIIDDYDKLFEVTKGILYKGEKLERQIKNLNLDELVEFRARFFEREFQIVTKQEVDFESLDEMIKYIKENYND